MIDATRRRGLMLLVLVAILLLLLVGWMAFARPDLGAYPQVHRFGIHGLWVVISYLFGRGTFLTLTGAPGEGPFRGVRGAVGWLIGLACALGLGLGSFVLDLTLTSEHTATSDSDHDLDWDWD